MLPAYSFHLGKARLHVADLVEEQMATNPGRAVEHHLALTIDQLCAALTGARGMTCSSGKERPTRICRWPRIDGL